MDLFSVFVKDGCDGSVYFSERFLSITGFLPALLYIAQLLAHDRCQDYNRRLENIYI